jgi:hypothetical protein
MKTFFPSKMLLFFLGLLTVGMLLALASGLETMEFADGTPFSYLNDDASGDVQAERLPDMLGVAILLTIAILVAVVAAFWFATPQQKKAMLVIGLIGTLLIMFLLGVTQKSPEEDATATATAQAASLEIPGVDEEPLTAQETVTPLVFEQPSIAPWIPFVISFVFILLLFLLAWVIFRFAAAERIPLNTLANIAERTVKEIKAGKDWGDAVVACYANMIQAVGENRGVTRWESVTPAEFSVILIQSRMPAAPVKRLTSLFERVRYGGKTASQKEIDEAIACLSEIVTACREAA